MSTSWKKVAQKEILNHPRMHIVEDTDATGKTYLEATEHGMERVMLTETEIWQKIANGEIIQKNTLAAWTMYQAQMRGRETPGQA